MLFDEQDDEEQNAEAPVMDTESHHGQNQFQDKPETYLQTNDAPKQSPGWKEKIIWSKLKSMARQYLTVPATSAGMERLFN